jgi:four helix bundle protein
VSDYRSLEVWQKGHALVLAIYRVTGTYPADEAYGLTSQTRRAAASVACNIAEGAGRGSDADLARFVALAIASANEVEYQLLLARDLGYLSPDTHDVLTTSAAAVRSMLVRLRQKLRDHR